MSSSCSQSTYPHFLFCLQMQAVYTSGEQAYSVMPREHSVHILSHHTSALRCLPWYQVSGTLLALGYLCQYMTVMSVMRFLCPCCRSGSEDITHCNCRLNTLCVPDRYYTSTHNGHYAALMLYLVYLV